MFFPCLFYINPPLVDNSFVQGLYEDWSGKSDFCELKVFVHRYSLLKSIFDLLPLVLELSDKKIRSG
jgi:hypothetical protein